MAGPKSRFYWLIYAKTVPMGLQTDLVNKLAGPIYFSHQCFYLLVYFELFYNDIYGLNFLGGLKIKGIPLFTYTVSFLLKDHFI